MTGRAPRVVPLASVLVVLVLLAGGCGSGSGVGSTAAGRAAPDLSRLAQSGNEPVQNSVAKSVPADQVQQRAVISTGQIELTSTDVAAARRRVDHVLAHDGGRVADENTTTNKHGTVTASHLVLRVPSAHFGRAMHGLAEVARLRSSVRKAEDVTTQVIDVNARIAAQRAGVRRLRQLVSKTADLRALLAVERALTTRQGELESLRQQRAYLADRTSLATITVDITRRTAPPPPPPRPAGGFVGGLRHGWHALVTVVVGILVGLGAALPFLVALALVGVPILLVVRRVRRTRHRPVDPEAV